jgi:SAM-dependent methyltransferase
MNRVEAFYDGQPEREWGRLERHRVEYALTLRALDEHLPKSPSRVIDIGGGVGRYAIDLARRGHAVTLVDLSQRCLDFARRKAGEAGVRLDSYVRADACDLSRFDNASFGAALLMGPLYHLLEHEQRLRAVRETRRVLRPGGRVFAAFLVRYAFLKYAAVHSPEDLLQQRAELETILETGAFRPPEDVKELPGFIDAWGALPDEVERLMTEAGIEKLDLIGCESLVSEAEDRLNQADPGLRERWFDLLYRVSRDPGIFGGCAHLLYVGEKRG